MFNRIISTITARRTAVALGGLAIGLFATVANAAPPSLFPFMLLPAPMQIQPQQMPPQLQPYAPADDATTEIEQPSRFKRQIVSYASREAAGTIVIDTANTYLYYLLGSGHAVRYGIGVGRDGFTWSGIQTVSRKAEWPSWTPPADMLRRQPYLPRFMAGGPGNPLGARAVYLGGTIYRIHGTNDPSTIGQNVSSGCIRLTNTDVADLYSRVNVGTKVVVLPGERRADSGNGRRG
ncbi:MAG: ErfK/YbiS/YcfS/YnhG [Tardiphaga sp.]|nr:ErfK/YbiS/YcfS/YnhG [Tardiphaga sp.]